MHTEYGRNSKKKIKKIKAEGKKGTVFKNHLNESTS